MARIVFQYREPGAPANSPALGVYFERIAQPNQEATNANGYATFDDVLVAYVFAPGNPKSEASCEIERVLPDGTVKVNKFFAHKYAEQIKHYKSGDESAGGGTPLSELGGLSAAQIETFKARGIHNIEALADLSDSAGDDMMGYRKWKGLAQAFIETRKGNAPMVKMAAALEERDARIANLERQLADVLSRFGDTEKRGPGRPRKEAA